MNKIYIQRKLCSVQNVFRGVVSDLKPSGNGAVISVAVLMFAAVLTVSVSFLQREKYRLEAENSALMLQNENLNEDVASLNDTVEEMTAQTEQQDQIIADQQKQLDTIEEKKDAEMQELLDTIENLDIFKGAVSRSVGYSSSVDQITQVKAVVLDLFGETDQAVALVEKLDAEAGRIRDYYEHYPDYFPTNGKLTSAYGWRRDPFNGSSSFHKGVDLANSVGIPVYAAAGGTVIAAEYQSSYGNMILIDHGNGYKTRYAHLNKILVKVGDQVSKTDKIGLMGKTGRASGPHLHFEVLLYDATQDPMRYIG